MSKTLFVGNLPYSMTEERLIALFEPFGTIVSARIVIDRETERPKGFGFVEFEEPVAADAAIVKLSGHLIDDRELIVNEARPRAFAQSGAR
jgi:RNA recognition motif-containing protein